MKNLLTISLVILSILTLSLKDTLNLAHSILHKIPNPFHYHGDISHHHELEIDDEDYHHESEEHHHEFEHDDDHDEDYDHYQDETYHPHSLKDHIHLGMEGDENSASKEETENYLKINWYINSFYSLKHHAFLELIKIKNNFIIGCFRLYTSPPFSPPPES